MDALSGSPATRLYTFWRNAGGEPVATDDVDGRHRQVWGNPGTDLPLAAEGPEGNWLWIAVDGIVLRAAPGRRGVGSSVGSFVPCARNIEDRLDPQRDGKRVQV